jgi:hypothetical protein
MTLFETLLAATPIALASMTTRREPERLFTQAALTHSAQQRLRYARFVRGMAPRDENDSRNDPGEIDSPWFANV